MKILILIDKQMKEANWRNNITQIDTMKSYRQKQQLPTFKSYGHIRHRQNENGPPSWLCCITQCNGRNRLRNK